MKALSDITLNTHLKGLAKTPQVQSAPEEESFGEVLKNSLNEVNRTQVAADRAAEQIAAGQTKNLHEAMIKLEEADLSLRMVVQMRNKALEAYQEIMRMQV